MFVGDALFAHSQGGIYSREAYQNALPSIAQTFYLNLTTLYSPQDMAHSPRSAMKSKTTPFTQKSANGLHTP